MNNDGYNEETNDVFGMDILYNESSDISNTALFNGKVSGVKWKSVMTSHPFTNIARSYVYSYDKLGQLRNAYFKANNGSGWNYRNDTYSEKNISYDLNGNILALRRNTMNLSTGALIAMDSLNYTYKDSGKGDKLQTVNDFYGAAGSYGFKGVSADPEEYVYDEEGRLKQDKNKNMTYTYNDIGKIDSISIGTATKYIKYTYTAAGELLSKRSYNGTSTTTTNYADNFIATGAVLSFISNAEGRVRTAAGVGTYEYFIKDQQGNVRVSFENSGGVAVVRQENSYYAFGMVHSATINPTDANKQLYNGGSEWQDDFDDDPDLMNTFFRQYDAVLGRFNAIDPLAEQTAELSVYNYGFNDPVMFNDPSGAYPDPPYGYDPYGRYYPPGAYRYTSLEEDWYNRSFDGWLRNQYYSAGMGNLYEQQYASNPLDDYTKKTVGYLDIGTREKVDGSPLDAVGINRVTISEYVRNPFANRGGSSWETFKMNATDWAAWKQIGEDFFFGRKVPGHVTADIGNNPVQFQTFPFPEGSSDDSLSDLFFELVEVDSHIAGFIDKIISGKIELIKELHFNQKLEDNLNEFINISPKFEEVNKAKSYLNYLYQINRLVDFAKTKCL